MATAVPVQPDAPHQGVLARHPLIFYFIMAYAGTWVVTVPLALSANGVGLLPFGISNGSVIFVSAVWVFLGPTLAAFIMTGTTEGREGIRCLLRRYVLWRVGLRWYLIVLLGLGARYYESAGFAVVYSSPCGLPSDQTKITPADLHAWVSEQVSTTDAEAIVFGGNGFRAVGAIAALEEDLGRPVLTANQALLWAALRMTDADPGSVSDYGRLFRHG